MRRLLSVMIAVGLGVVLGAPASGLCADPAPYVLGFTVGVTGRRAEMGIAVKRGAVIALDKINAAGGINGRKLKAIFYDGESKPVANVKNTKRIIDVDQAAACMGYISVGGTLASVQTATDGETLLFSCSPAIVTGGKTKKWMFTVVPDQRIASVPILLKNLLDRGAKKIAYLHVDTAYGKLGTAAFKIACKDLNIKPAIVEEYSPQAVDLGTQIAHIKAAGADGILITGNLADTVMALKTAREQGVKAPIVCDYAIVGPEFIKLGKELVEGVVSTSLKTLVAEELPADDPQKKVCMELYTEFVKRHNTFSLYPGHSWDQVNLIAKALGKVDPKLDPAKEADTVKIRTQLRDALENLKGVVGQNGIFNYSPTDHIGLAKGCYIPVVVKDGKWRMYAK